MNPLYIVLGILVLFIIIYAGIYNGLVRARLKVKEAWSGIDVQLKRRYELVPNLVNTVKGYATHEKELLEKVTAARASALQVPAGHVADQSQAENTLTGALKSVFAIAENYPDLKANQNFLSLQSQLAETEDQIAASRRIYNGNVTNLNGTVESFPSNLIAGMHNFTKEEFFELDEEEKKVVRKAVEVKF